MLSEQKPVILVLEPAGNLWGSERVLLDFLRQRNRFSYIICCPPNTPFSEECQSLGITVEPTFEANLHRKGKVRRALAAWTLIKAGFKHRPDLIYLNQAGCFRIASIASRFLRIPIVAHIRIEEDGPYLANCRPDPVQLRRIIAISPWIANQVDRSFGSSAAVPIETIYDGFQPPLSTIQKNETNTQSIPKETNRLVCVGRVQPIKGQDLLLDAMAILDSNGGFQCRFVGSGDQFFEDLKSKTSEMNLEGTVEWTGFLEKPTFVMQDSDFLIVSSRVEPLGRVIFEGWTAGCVPLVYAGSGGAAQVIEASGGGLLFDQLTPISLADGIRRLGMLSQHQRTRLLEAGRAWLEKNTDPDQYARQMEQVFAKILQKDRASSTQIAN